MLQKTYFKTKDYCKVKFIIQPDNAVSVSILGLNNDWNDPVDLKKKKDGSFSTEVKLPKESTHQFKYLVNETEWMNEPEADKEVPNEYGGTNSFISL